MVDAAQAAVPSMHLAFAAARAPPPQSTPVRAVLYAVIARRSVRIRSCRRRSHSRSAPAAPSAHAGQGPPRSIVSSPLAATSPQVGAWQHRRWRRCAVGWRGAGASVRQALQLPAVYIGLVAVAHFVDTAAAHAWCGRSGCAVGRLAGLPSRRRHLCRRSRRSRHHLHAVSTSRRAQRQVLTHR